MAEKFYSTLKRLGFSNKEYVLALPSWYPTTFDPYPGDFNQRHIIAAAGYMPQVVLYIGKDTTKTFISVTETIILLSNNVVEVTIIYPRKKNRIADAFYSNIMFLKLLFRYAKLIIAVCGKPAVLHAYTAIRGGLGAWLLSRKWKIPFVLTENWTIYYPEDPCYVRRRNVLFKAAVKKVFTNAKMFLPVTNDLQNIVEKRYGFVPSTVIRNVVDTSLFYYKEEDYNDDKIFKFIHISTMNYQKNPEGLLSAFKIFHSINPQTCLWMVGPYTKEIYQYAKSLGFAEGVIHFTGGIAYSEVPKLLQRSGALVLFSRYENLPCVILESLCCGVPVISTNVGGIREVIDSSNGILLESENEKQLVDAFTQICSSAGAYNKKEIAETATTRFSYHVVGKAINDVYKLL